jgi:D-amino-acid dehydrogenase
VKVAVVGAGLAGLTAADALAADGAEVTVFDKGAGPGLATSSRNGSLQHPSLAEPWNAPGVLREVLRDLGNENAAVLLRWRALPSLLGWGARFVRESTPDRHFAHTVANMRLARYSVARMAGFRAEGIDYAMRPGGTLMVYRSAAAHEKALAWAKRLAAHGQRFRPLSREEVVSLEPATAPIAPQIAGGMHYADDERGDPLAFCRALAARLAGQRGARLHYGLRIECIDADAGRVRGVVDATGTRHEADAVVLAAAAHSTALARTVGLSLPVRPVKGYSLTLPQKPNGPRIAAGDAALHMAVVPVGDDRVRVAGTAELCGFDLALTPARLANLRAMLAQLYPGYAATLRDDEIEPWAGLRPMCADGVCLVGATRVRGLWLHTGHGHLGWTQTPGSARVLADLMQGRTPAIDPAPYAPARFGLASG